MLSGELKEGGGERLLVSDAVNCFSFPKLVVITHSCHNIPRDTLFHSSLPLSKCNYEERLDAAPPP